MVAMPAQCLNPMCGAIFPSSIHVDNATNISFGKVRVTCPVCGSPARGSEGVFNVSKDTIEVLTAPQTTLDMLRDLQEILNRAKDGQISDQDAEAAAAQISPQLGALVQAIKGRPDYLNYLLGLISIAIACWGLHTGDEYQAKVLEQQGQMTTSLHEIAQGVPQPVDKDREQEAPQNAKSEPVAPSVSEKTPSKRRATVNSIRRADLKSHRSAFGGAAIAHRFKHNPKP